MNWKAWMPLAVAVVLGLIAARVALTMVSSEGESTAVPSNLVPIVLSAGEVQPGTELKPDMLRIGHVNAPDVPSGAFMSIEQAVGRVAKIALTPNQAIVPTLLADEGSTAGKGATLPEGMRAITVEINDVSGVAGFIEPRSRVDVVATLTYEGKSLAKTLLENIEVFAVGSRTADAPPAQPGQAVEQARTITLLVTPEQGEKLELATSSTRVRLVLRNSSDGSSVATEGVTIADLRGDTAQRDTDPFKDPFVALSEQNSEPTTRPTQSVAGFPAPRQQWTVEIIRAGASSSQTFEIEPKPETVKQPKQDKSLISQLFSGLSTQE